MRASDATGGLVEPTLGRTMRLAGYDRDFRLVALRDADTFEARFEAVAPASVELDEERATVRVPPGVELDLGATAKALAADRGARAAHAAAGCGVLVALGGDIAVAGEPPPGGWSIRIADDHAAPLDGAGPTVALAGGGLASSGTTVRRWRSGDAELHHIVDPRTGRPADTPWRTVTVAAASCVDANVASTAAVVLGETAPSWLAERRLPARLVARDGRTVRVAAGPRRRHDRRPRRSRVGAHVWYLTRGTGVVALLLLTAVVLLGVTGATRWQTTRCRASSSPACTAT